MIVKRLENVNGTHAINHSFAASPARSILKVSKIMQCKAYMQRNIVFLRKRKYFDSIQLYFSNAQKAQLESSEGRLFTIQPAPLVTCGQNFSTL